MTDRYRRKTQVIDDIALKDGIDVIRRPGDTRPEWLGRNAVTIPLFYTLCTNPDMFRKELKRLGMAEAGIEFLPRMAGACCHILTGTTHGSTAIVVTIDGSDETRTGPVAAAMLAHEAVHIWQEMRDIIGEKRPSSEFEAYSVQRIVLELLSEYSRQVHGTGRSGAPDPGNKIKVAKK